MHDDDATLTQYGATLVDFLSFLIKSMDDEGLGYKLPMSEVQLQLTRKLRASLEEGISDVPTMHKILYSYMAPPSDDGRDPVLPRGHQPASGRDIHTRWELHSGAGPLGVPDARRRTLRDGHKPQWLCICGGVSVSGPSLILSVTDASPTGTVPGYAQRD